MATTPVKLLDTLKLADHPIVGFSSDIVAEIISAIGSKTASSSMHIYDGWGPSINPSSYSINPNFWLPSVAAQITAIPAYKSGGWNQSAGCTAITPRHGITVTHGTGYGPAIGATVRFANNADGTTFETTILKKEEAAILTDFAVVLFADELPSWVHKMPFLGLSAARIAALGVMNTPLLSVSQGNVSSSSDEFEETPNNMKLYVRNFLNSGAYGTGNIATFRHNTSSGDSGMPQFLLHDGDLYFMNANSGLYYGIEVQSGINATILAADSSASISTGYTITIVSDPTA